MGAPQPEYTPSGCYRPSAAVGSANGPFSRMTVTSGDFLGRGRLVISEADVGSLWNASLCPDGSFGLFYGSEADVMGLRRASLGGECCFVREWSW